MDYPQKTILSRQTLTDPIDEIAKSEVRRPLASQPDCPQKPGFHREPVNDPTDDFEKSEIRSRLGMAYRNQVCVRNPQMTLLTTLKELSMGFSGNCLGTFAPRIRPQNGLTK